jgi:hypothetical protein
MQPNSGYIFLQYLPPTRLGAANDMVNEPTSREKPSVRRNWREDARAAIKELQLIAHGEREAEMLAIAKHHGHYHRLATSHFCV